jgi:lipopolysaccharide heptosyltransferase II
VRQRPESVLVVRTGAIGDVVNALTFATALADAWAGVRIGWVAHVPVLPLLDGHPALERVHPWRRERGVAGLLAALREARAMAYDLCVDLQRIAKSALFARASGAERVVGFDRARTKELSWCLIPERIPPGPAVSHRIEQYLEVARYLVGPGGAPAAAPRHAFPADAAADEHAGRLVEELGGAPLVVALGAHKPANRWEPERFGRLAARAARELGLPVCLMGAASERALAERAQAALRGELAGADAAPVRDLVGRTDLRQLSALLARARLFVGGDTGPMHLAAARGTRVVALFGAADPRVTGPFGAGHRVLRVPPPCAPCLRRTCNLPRHHCMQDIQVEPVLEAVRELSGESRAPSPAQSQRPGRVRP